MSLPTRFVRRLLSHRRGSVLILVVALLLLMAIIGTAFISGARTDRYAAVQHNTNTQIDLLVQGVENNLESEIVSGIFGTTTTPNASTNLTTAFSTTVSRDDDSHRCHRWLRWRPDLQLL